MKFATLAEVQGMIETVRGTTSVSLYAETTCEMNKTGNPFFGTTKKNWVSGIIGFDYENSVNNQLGREGKEMNFEAQQHKWAIMPENGCRSLRQNKDRSKTYLWIKIQSAKTPTYHFKGQEISKDTIAPYLKPHSKPHTQNNNTKEIFARTYGLHDILAIKMFGDVYVIAENVADHVKIETAIPAVPVDF